MSRKIFCSLPCKNGYFRGFSAASQSVTRVQVILEYGTRKQRVGTKAGNDGFRFRSGSGLVAELMEIRKPSFPAFVRNFSVDPLTKFDATSNAASIATKNTKYKEKRDLKWVAIPLSVGILYIGLLQLYKISNRNSNDSDLFAIVETLPIYLRVYASLPLGFISEVWGRINNIKVAPFLRLPLYKTYSYFFGCNLDEMALDQADMTVDEQLARFENLGQFFYRGLKVGARAVNESAALVAPCDGRVLACGEVINGQIDEVKRVSFKVDNLIGGNTNDMRKDQLSKNTKLFYAVIYLAPGDYHRYHSPTNFTISSTRHFIGEMFSVSPFIVSRFPGLFSLNERVAVLGDWEYGFFGFVAVAATNVGKIVFVHMPELETNTVRKPLRNHGVASLIKNHSGQVWEKGQQVGGFKLGSTIVMVFEAPLDFKLKIQRQEFLKMGQTLA